MSTLAELLPLLKDGETGYFRRSTDIKMQQLEVSARDALLFDKERSLFKLERTYQMPREVFIVHGDIDAHSDWVRCG